MGWNFRCCDCSFARSAELGVVGLIRIFLIVASRGLAVVIVDAASKTYAAVMRVLVRASGLLVVTVWISALTWRDIVAARLVFGVARWGLVLTLEIFGVAI